MTRGFPKIRWGSNTGFINGLLNNSSRSSLSWYLHVLIRKHKSIHSRYTVTLWPQRTAAVHTSSSLSENTFSKPSEGSSKISLFLFKEQVNNHILKREPKGRMKDPSQTRNEQALILSRRTLVEPRQGNAKYQQVLHARSSLLFQFNVQLITAV